MKERKSFLAQTVVFYDSLDFLIVLAALGFMVVPFFVLAGDGSSSQPTAIHYAIKNVGRVLLLYSIRLSCHYNRSILTGMLVGFTRYCLIPFLALLVFISLMYPTLFPIKPINGTRIYERLGRELESGTLPLIKKDVSLIFGWLRRK